MAFKPMKYTKIPHTVDLQLVVCMYTSHRVKSVSDSIFSERREEIAEDIPAPAEDVPAPAPAPHWTQ